MAADAQDVAAIVLAAGSASRFGSAKALALLEGRPLLQHVLDRLSAARMADVVVVLGAAADDIEAAINWRDERRIRNPAPQRGLASSLQVGLEALSPETRAALVVLGDQPRLRVDVIATVIGRWLAGSKPVVVPRYSESGTLNPVLLDRASWPLAMALDGDRGMGPLIAALPHLVTDVSAEGDNPDVDTAADLERLGDTDQVEAAGKGSR